MLCSRFSEKLLGIQEAEVKNIEENAGEITIEIELPGKECECRILQETDPDKQKIYPNY